MDPIKAAHLEIAKELFLHNVKDFDVVAVARMAADDPKRVESALGAAAAFAYQAAEAFAYVYRFEDLTGE
jgi:hypothetical protein